jgi:hypothetical protein
VGQYGLGGPIQQLTSTDYVNPKRKHRKSWIKTNFTAFSVNKYCICTGD